MGTEVATDGGGGLPAEGAPSTWLVVRPPTVAATRHELEAQTGAARSRPVVGWADLTAPNLVDLVEDLRCGPGGSHLVAIAVRWPAEGPGWVDDVATRRGLACLQRYGLALRLVGSGPPGVVERLAAAEPGLVVVADGASAPGGSAR